MVLNRVSFFLVLFTIIVLPFLIHKFIWLARSETTMGTVSFVSNNDTGQRVHRNAVVLFRVGKDTAWFNANDSNLYKAGEPVPVCYQRDNPGDARINVFAAIWGDTLIYGGIPLLILIVIFLDPQIIPFGSKWRFSLRKPFVSVLTRAG